MNLVLLFVLGAIWGTSFLFIKVVVGEVGPLTLVMGRTGLAAMAIWLWLWVRRVPFPRTRRLWQTFAMIGLLNGALPFALISWGEQYIPSGLAALLQATTPLFTVLFAHFFTRDDRITLRKLAGVGLGFVGVGVLLGPRLWDGLHASLWGQLAVVGSSVCYAIATILAHHRLRGQPPLVSAAGQFTMAFVYIFPLSFLLEHPLSHIPSWGALGSWVTLALLCTVVAYAIYYTLLERTRATFVTSVTYLVPINGLILGALILHETINPMIILSLFLVLGGVLLVKGGD